MTTPKISVIVPVYNVEKYLQECLDSIMHQTLTEIEIICVNDGSTDSSLSILQHNAEKDPRIKIISQTNKGPAYSRYMALNVASGEYILFCDSDDHYIGNHVFEALYSKTKSVNADILCFAFKIAESNIIIGEKDALNLDSSKLVFTFTEVMDVLFKIPTSIVCKMYKKELFDKYSNWYHEEKIFVDTVPIHFETMLRAEKICFVNDVYYLYVNNPNSTTHSWFPKKMYSLLSIFEIVYNIFERGHIMNEGIKPGLAIYFIGQFFHAFAIIPKKLTRKEWDIAEDFYSKLRSEAIRWKFLIYPSIIKLNKNSPYAHLVYVYKLIVKMDSFRLYRMFELLKVNKNKRRYSESIQLTLQQEIEKITIENETIKNYTLFRICRCITKALCFPYELIKCMKNYNLLKQSKLFDRKWYLEQYSDVANMKIDPLKHYLQFGWKEGRNPSSKFNGSKYLKKRPDVRSAGMCPLVHYERYGKKEQEHGEN